MLNPNKISEIRIILDQLVKDVDTLEHSSNVSSVKWEELFISTALLREKLTTLKYDYERLTLRDMISRLKTGEKEAPEREVPFIAGNAEEEKEDMVEDDRSMVISDEADRADEADEERGGSGRIEIDKTESSEVLFKEVVKETMFNSAGNKTNNPVNESEEILFDYFEDEEDSVTNNKNRTPSWMLDNPGPSIDDIHRAITLNDKIYFTRELFKGDEDQYRLTLQRLNEMESLEQAVEYTRRAFSHWDEESPAAYRFYMVLRRRYNG